MLLHGRQPSVGQTVADPRALGVDLPLEARPHRIDLRDSYVRGPGNLEPRWRQPGGFQTIIPPSARRPS